MKSQIYKAQEQHAPRQKDQASCRWQEGEGEGDGEAADAKVNKEVNHSSVGTRPAWTWVLGSMVSFSFGSRALAISPGFAIASLYLYLSDAVRILFLSVAGPHVDWGGIGTFSVCWQP